MKTRTLGRSGIEVSCVGLGGMPLSLEGRPNEAAASRLELPDSELRELRAAFPT